MARAVPGSAADGEHRERAQLSEPPQPGTPIPLEMGREVQCPGHPPQQLFSYSASTHRITSRAASQELLQRAQKLFGLCGSWQWWHPPPKGHSGLLGSGLAPFLWKGGEVGLGLNPMGILLPHQPDKPESQICRSLGLVYF